MRKVKEVNTEFPQSNKDLNVYVALAIADEQIFSYRLRNSSSYAKKKRSKVLGEKEILTLLHDHWDD